MKQTDPHFKMRIPSGIKHVLEEAAKDNNRSVSAEIIARLDESLQGATSWYTAAAMVSAAQANLFNLLRRIYIETPEALATIFVRPEITIVDKVSKAGIPVEQAIELGLKEASGIDDLDPLTGLDILTRVHSRWMAEGTLKKSYVPRKRSPDIIEKLYELSLEERDRTDPQPRQSRTKSLQ